MENCLSIFQSILSTKGSYLKLYLDGLEDYRKCLTQNYESGELVQHISSLLTKSDTRSLGIYLLAFFIEDFPIDIYEKKCNLWTTLILKACNSRHFHLEVDLIYDVLEKLVKKSQQSQDGAKTFASTYLCKIYESVVNVSISNVKFPLKCIETCLLLYPAPSGPFRSIIEKFLWKNMNSTDEEVIQSCGKSLHLLQQIKCGGVSGINYKTQWKNYQVQLIGAIHTIYNEMFANCTELYEYKVEAVKLPWDNSERVSFDVDPVKKAAQLYTRCHSLIKYLEMAIREPFPVEKPILLKKILNIINRGLSVNCVTLEQKPMADNIALSILLPKLHVDLLKLLTALMITLQGQLRPYAELILDIVIESIKWTSAKNANGDQQKLQKIRTKAYDTLSRWCKMFHSGNCVDTVAEYLIQQILSDITPVQNEVTLKVLSGTRKHLSKKERRQLHNIQNEQSNIVQTYSNDANHQKHFSDEIHQELCVSALRCLQNILFSSSNFLKPTIIKSVQLRVTGVCAMLCEYPPKQSTHLYSKKNCRVEIYNTLYAILVTPHILCPPPTEIAFTMLRTAFIRDASPKVRIHCSFILKNLEKLIHPQKESLLFTIDAREVRNTFIKHGQESLMHETAIKCLNEVLNTEFKNFVNAHNSKSNEANEKNDKNYDEVINSSPLPNHINSSCSPNNLKLVTEQFSKYINSVNTNEIDANNISDVIESANQKDGMEKSTKVDEILLIVADDGLSKSTEFALRIDDERDTTIGKDVTDSEETIYEPLSKKPKIHKAIKFNTNDTRINHHGQDVDEDEDAIVADIVSEFVDELY